MNSPAPPAAPPDNQANPGVAGAACDRCDSPIHDEEVLARSGVKARLALSTSALAVGRSFWPAG